MGLLTLLLFSWAAVLLVLVAILILLTISLAGKDTFSLRCNLSETANHGSYDVSSRGRPFHCTKTNGVGGEVVLSSLWAKIASGSKMGLLP